MPSIANIVLNDGQGTPVAHTFAPTRSANSPSTFVFEDRVAGVKAGYNTIRVETKQNTANGSTKINVVIKVPRLAVTAPASGSGIQPNPTEAYSELVSLSITRPAALEQAVADDAFAFLKNLMSNTQFTAWVQQGDLPF